MCVWGFNTTVPDLASEFQITNLDIRCLDWLGDMEFDLNDSDRNQTCGLLLLLYNLVIRFF